MSFINESFSIIFPVFTLSICFSIAKHFAKNYETRVKETLKINNARVVKAGNLLFFKLFSSQPCLENYSWNFVFERNAQKFWQRFIHFSLFSPFPFFLMTFTLIFQIFFPIFFCTNFVNLLVKTLSFFSKFYTVASKVWLFMIQKKIKKKKEGEVPKIIHPQTWVEILKS